MKLLRLMILLEMMFEMVMGVLNMKVDNVANQGGRRCASAQAALDEKFGLGRKF